MSMEGGHGNAAAYGKTIQDMGIDSAVTAALAAATLGLVFGGLIGGPVVKYLIKRYNLTPEHRDESYKNYGEVEYNQSLHNKFKPTQIFFIQFTILVFCMALGTYIGDTFTHDWRQHSYVCWFNVCCRYHSKCIRICWIKHC